MIFHMHQKPTDSYHSPASKDKTSVIRASRQCYTGVTNVL